jgi:hypothetical protein
MVADDCGDTPARGDGLGRADVYMEGAGSALRLGRVLLEGIADLVGDLFPGVITIEPFCMIQSMDY